MKTLFKWIGYILLLLIGAAFAFNIGGINLFELVTTKLSTLLNISSNIFEWIFSVLLLLIGLVLIIKGGDYFVDAASWIAKVSGIPTFIIGATIVSLATTLPEILVSSISAASGNIEIAVGNAVGSVNANIGIIMAISLACLPGLFDKKLYLPKAIILIGAILVLWCSCLFGKGELILPCAIVILLVFVGFIIENIISSKKEAEKNKEKEEKYKVKDWKEVVYNIFLFLVGAASIAVGAMLLSTYGEKIAYLIGNALSIDENVMAGLVGVTIIAIGTSLPELTTTLIAIKKKQNDLSVGNVIGANIIDITLILPLCSFISGGSLPVQPYGQSLFLDMPYCLLVALLALVPAMFIGKFKKWQGITMLGTYAIYLTLLCLNVFGVIHLG